YAGPNRVRFEGLLSGRKRPPLGSYYAPDCLPALGKRQGRALECRTQNAERRMKKPSPVFFFNSSFCVLRSAFNGGLAKHWFPAPLHRAPRTDRLANASADRHRCPLALQCAPVKEAAVPSSNRRT